jgi:hypothetical protein
MPSQHYIFLSPHFDDVALSCGALVHHLSRLGHTVEVWTIMSGFPHNEIFSEFAQEMHLEWGMTSAEVVHVRRDEDWAACQAMGTQPRYFNWTDVIYRKDPETGLPVVNNNDELFGKSPEGELINEIANMLMEEIPNDAKLITPISLGNHIDHRTVTLAGEKSGYVGSYYADYPYILNDPQNPANHRYQWAQFSYQLDESDLQAWQEAVLSYSSQLSMFWRDEEETKLAIRNYWAGGGGQSWQKRTTIR